MSETGPKAKAARPELIAAPPVVTISASRRPVKSISGPTVRATTSEPRPTSVATKEAVAFDQPKSAWMTGNRLPKVMRS